MKQDISLDTTACAASHGHAGIASSTLPHIVACTILLALLLAAPFVAQSAYAAPLTGGSADGASEKADATDTSSREMFRLYNPNTGEHFYTCDTDERDSLKSSGWRHEGSGWIAPAQSGTPVYRLYSGTDHHYTTSRSECNDLMRSGWTYEGIGWYSEDAQGIELYRLYNPNVDPQAAWFNSGSHHYTTDADERDSLVQAGWSYEGVCWNATAEGKATGDWISALDVSNHVDQIIAVEAWGTQATVSMHEKADGTWRELLRTTEGWVGKNGIGAARAGIAFSPTGVMYPDMAFGILDDPGCPMGYVKVDYSHYWCGDSESPLYNQFVSTRDTTDFNFYDSEHLLSCGATYNYCLNMGWNAECAPYGGAAFFLHCSQGRPTDGCVTVPEPLMIQILQTVRPGCAIVIDTPSGIMQY